MQSNMKRDIEVDLDERCASEVMVMVERGSRDIHLYILYEKCESGWTQF